MGKAGKMSKIRFFLILTLLLVQPLAQALAQAEFQLPVRNYQKPPQDVYLDTLGAISASGFKVIEIQSKNGLVYFGSQDMKFLAKVSGANSSAVLKITPVSSNYKDEILPINVIFNKLDRKYNAKPTTHTNL